MTFQKLIGKYREDFQKFIKKLNPYHVIFFLGSNDFTLDDLVDTNLYECVKKTFKMVKLNVQNVTISVLEPEQRYLGTKYEEPFKKRRKNFINWLRRNRKAKKLDHVINMSNCSVAAVAIQDAGSYQKNCIELSPEGIVAVGLVLEGFYRCILVHYR